MKKIISLSLVLLLLLSSVALMVSCDIAAEGEKESETPVPGRIYGDYQVITLTDEATIDLVENMWEHDSWDHIWPSSGELNDSNFKNIVLVQNTYLADLLKRDDAIDLLIWRFDKFANQDRAEDEVGGEANINFYVAFRNESIESRMSEAQKEAVSMIFDVWHDSKAAWVASQQQ